MKNKLTDTHCHLDDTRYRTDLEDLLTKEEAPGFILAPGCNYESSREVIEIAENFPNVYAAVGVHPTDASVADGIELERFRELASRPKVLAIGEIGLDYHYPDNAPAEKQKEVFIDQIKLASELHLPFVVHAREAMEDALEIVDTYARTPYVFHAFSGSLEEARAITSKGNYISVGGVLTFKNPGNLPEIVAEIPLESIMLETDGPYMTPVPFRGKRNEPAYTSYVAEKIAELKNIPVETVLETTASNARDFFAF